MKNKDEIIAILERILSYAEFNEKHLKELELFARKLKELRDEN
jgi:hypothetical protein